MYKQSIETRESIRGLITAEEVSGGRDVVIYIREARNDSITAEAKIKLSPEALYNLVYPIVRDAADEIRYGREGI